jgi:hypothetical protein
MAAQEIGENPELATLSAQRQRRKRSDFFPFLHAALRWKCFKTPPRRFLQPTILSVGISSGGFGLPVSGTLPMPW